MDGAVGSNSSSSGESNNSTSSNGDNSNSGSSSHENIINDPNEGNVNSHDDDEEEEEDDDNNNNDDVVADLAGGEASILSQTTGTAAVVAHDTTTNNALVVSAAASSATASSQRWTCEACGCYTNEQSDRSCTICGTSHSGPSLMRRPGGSASFSARAGWFARGLGGGISVRRGMMSDDLGMDDDVLWEVAASVGRGGPGGVIGHDPSGLEDGDTDNPLDASIALDMATGDIAGGSLVSSNRRIMERHQRLIDVARAFSQATNRGVSGGDSSTSSNNNSSSNNNTNPVRLLQTATENSAHYQPIWSKVTSPPGRPRSIQAAIAATTNASLPLSSTAFVGIQIGDGEQANMAHLPSGSCPGLAVRAEPALPRSDILSPFRVHSPSSGSGISRTSKRVFGFRVAFDNPRCAIGASLGGCYLIGITTSSFHAYNEQNGLHQSPHFWGIEDSGQKFEGTRYHQGRSRRAPITQGQQSSSTSSCSIQISSDTVPMNSSGALFGSREVVTVVVDLENRNITFWRDDTCLGTLIHNIPRNGNLYPIAVPYNCGATVAITSLQNDPLPLLQTFAADWREKKLERNEEIRRRLEQEKVILIQERKTSEGLKAALRELFQLYSTPNESIKYSIDRRRNLCDDLDGRRLRLCKVMASRLWYRCGIKIALLNDLLQGKEFVTFHDFLHIITKVIEEDCVTSTIDVSPNRSSEEDGIFEVGDKVELVEAYTRFGDASMGPLSLGERGVVTEVKKDGNTEKLSIRVLHNGRRWWYQPQALLSERSRHFESSASWFLRRILRVHGYDNITLTSLVGQPLTSSSWRYGDIVAPSPEKLFDPIDDIKHKLVARIIPDSSRTPSALASRSRDSCTVFVEYVGQDFANAVGFKPNGSYDHSVGLESRRIQCSKLVFSNCFVLSENHPASNDGVHNSSSNKEINTDLDGGDFDNVPISVKVRADVAGLGRFERSSIDSVAKESKKRGDSLASLFAAGLPDAILSAINIAERQMNSPEPKGDVADRLMALGGLVNSITSQLFSRPDELIETSNSSSLVPVVDYQITEEIETQDGENAIAVANDRMNAESALLTNSTNETTREQGRNAVLSFLSRANRRGPESAFLNDLADGREGHRTDFPARLFSSMREVPPFVFGSPSHFLEAWSAAQNETYGNLLNSTSSNKCNEGSANDREPTNADLEAESRAIKMIRDNFTYLDSILRCRADVRNPEGGTRGSNQKEGGAEISSFVRTLTMNGILINSSYWTKAIIEEFAKKLQLESFQMKDICDEEGTPILQLAIGFGCTIDILMMLIGHGCRVGSDEINIACDTDQPHVVKLLFKYADVNECTIDISTCSLEVRTVVEQTRIQKGDLGLRMREATSSFVTILIHKLLKLCLTARRSNVTRFDRFDRCSKAVCEILVGNVLLRALHNAQKISISSTSKTGLFVDKDTDKSGRCSVDEISIELSIGPQGLLGSLPRELYGNCVLSEKSYFIQYMTVVEDILYSKDIADTASGLTLLFILLKNYREIRSCSEIDRFGIHELVSYHNVLTASRIAELLSRQVCKKLSVSTKETEQNTDDNDFLSSFPTSGNCVVICPAKHTAVLHITRHSNFRCDLCGSGVDRGRPMHGCRECDWDACEDCTDRAECGLVKSSEIKRIASDCLKLFDELDSGHSAPSNMNVGKVLTELSEEDTGPELSGLAVRFLQHDIQAAKELGILLNEPGKVSIHQFLATILPSLHESLIGCNAVRAVSNSTGKHQSKKPRVLGKGGNSSMHSPEYRLEFCREFIRMMIMESRVTPRPILTAGIHASMHQSNESTDSSPSDDKEDMAKRTRDLCFAISSSEILRRLHQVLSLNENIQILSSGTHEVGPSKGCELQSLSKLYELHLFPTSLGTIVSSSTVSVVHVEPLVAIGALKSQILRSYMLNDPLYLSFCESLAFDKAIIIERPLTSTIERKWRLAQIVSFDRSTKSHGMVHAKKWANEMDSANISLNRYNMDCLCTGVVFEENPIQVILAAREYFILERTGDGKRSIELVGSVTSDIAMVESDPRLDSALSQLVGTRVESNCNLNAETKPYTVVSAKRDMESPECETYFSLISDEGELFSNIRSDQLIMIEDEPIGNSLRHRERATGMPFFTARSRVHSSRESEESSCNTLRERALKRSWSAIALTESMRPAELITSSRCQETVSSEVESNISWQYQLGNKTCILSVPLDIVEHPPRVRVLFALKEHLPGVCFDDDFTIVKMLAEAQKQQDKFHDWSPRSLVQLFFALHIDYRDVNRSETIEAGATGDPLAASFIPLDSGPLSSEWNQHLETRSRKLSTRSIGSADEISVVNLCDGIDELCMQCMEVIGLFAECADDNSIPIEKDESSIAGMANVNLSKKLMDQLDDSLCVVGGLLPKWCVAGPSFCPRVFSYEARRALLERSAFGASRSTLTQQEAKVNVGRLRQRMASLRARAVELVGEAFSGGADDPTALQLQADELYGMEEAIGTRVIGLFRAAKWQEYSLQVAKAAVRRDYLLEDAVAVMETYSRNAHVCRRRLEVRFEGESGFDAASGDEAGVTRGFYADVAESLLSSEAVAGIFCSSRCAAVASNPGAEKTDHMELDYVDKESAKLPLWIPDLDNSSQVVIPTPRANPRSSLGLFPRPIPIYHPQHAEVLRMFRFIGRLFAAAMRDGFMFPVPISCSFLKLVQHAPQTEQGFQPDKAAFVQTPILSANDLPRPGFLGGEVYAADYHIGRALDELENLDPPLSHAELQRRYEEIESNKDFGRAALGKTYDLSFKEYFEERTFVDPLDPTQGENAVPLCNNGHTIQVCIFNIREWVLLAKNFMLYEGIIGQAIAFRQGVEDLFPAKYLSVFTPAEIQRDVCGNGGDVDNWDEGAVRKLFKLDGGKGAAEALVAVAAIGGEGGAALSRRFGPASPTITFLVKALLEASPVQRRQFLSFVTSVPIVTPGRIEVVPMVSPNGDFLPMRDPNCLPRANTCARRLYLPKFESYETFSDVLMSVVREESKFKGFYEWRGF